MKFKRAVCTVILCTFTLCGCKNTEPLPSEVVISDSGTDEEEIKPFPVESCGVMIEKAVEKAVSLSPATTEIICELGFESRLAAVSKYCDYPENLTAVTVGSTENPDIDAIIALQPDAVFTLSKLSERDIYRLEHEGIAVLTPKTPESMEDYYNMYKEIASAFYGRETTGTDKSALKAVETAQNARLALENAAAELQLESFVYVTEKLTTAGKGTFADAVLGLSGENLCSEGGYAAAETCGEGIPKYIIADDKLTNAKLKTDKTLAKMINGGAEVLYVTSSFLERPTARTAEVFRQISEQLSY